MIYALRSSREKNGGKIVFKLGVSTLPFTLHPLTLLYDANRLSALERDLNPERNFEKIRETGREKSEIKKYESEH